MTNLIARRPSRALSIRQFRRHSTGSLPAYLLGAVALAACTAGDSGPTSPTPVPSVAFVTLNSPNTTMVIGQTQALTATLRDALGRVLTGRTVSWTSSKPGVALVDAQGLVTAVGPGSATVVAAIGGKSGSAEITVILPPAPVALVTLTTPNSTMLVGQTQSLTVTLRDSLGNVVTGRIVSWATSNADVALVDAQGLVTAVAPGSASVMAAIDGRRGSAEIAVSLPPGGVFVASGLSAGSAGNTCALTTGGSAYCWGSNDGGIVDSLTIDPPFPVNVARGRVFATLGVGAYHVCALVLDGTAYCWGSNVFGELGDGTTNYHSGATVVASGLNFTAVSVGYTHTCALTAAGTAYCWGLNEYGELGDGTASPYRGTPLPSTPVAVTGGLTFASISAGRNVTCGLTTSGRAYCWGSNYLGLLGNGASGNSSTPVAVAGELTLAAVSVSDTHACGVTTGGAAYCWGDNRAGELGNGTHTSSSVPVAVAGGLSFAVAIAGVAIYGDETNENPISSRTCGVTTAGAAYCWGDNAFGSLGNGTMIPSSTPVAVAGGRNFATITAGSGYNCGVTSGAAYCWGDNTHGQLGNGTTRSSTVPVPVASQP
jgi:alpha-tubulin suppressor-like RCC1 family protein